jgi:N-methylhydantoinase A
LGSTSALAGKLKLDEGCARAALDRVGKPLGLDAVETAAGIIRIVNTNMAIDLRLALQEEGQDPRRFAMVAFGGAGPLHAGQIARMVGIRRACTVGCLTLGTGAPNLGQAHLSAIGGRI